MASESVFVYLQESETFWTLPKAPFPEPAEVLMSDSLYCVQGSKGVERGKYVLTATRLIEVQSQSENSVEFREGDIRWTTIEPRHNRQRLVVQYGFSVKYRDSEMLFFASSQSACDEWLQKLASVAVLWNLEYVYSREKVIEECKVATIYEGLSLDTGEKVSIREIPKLKLRRNPLQLQSLMREIQIWKSISHPNVARLYQIYEDDDRVSLVFENLQGTLLSESIQQQRFSEAEAKGLIASLMELLVYLEGKSILHRDLKPRNFLLTDPSDRTKFKITDFSIARAYGEVSISDFQGSPGYIAPEVLLRKHYSPSVDLYTAGIVFYMLFAGRNPFEAAERSQKLAKNAKSAVVFGPEFRSIDEKIVTIIRIMTSANPDTRMNAGQLRLLLMSRLKPQALPQLPILVREKSAKAVRKRIELCRNQWGHVSFSTMPKIKFNERFAQSGAADF